MNMTDVMQPKVWYETKRGVGMFMAGVGTLLPVLGAWTGVTIDSATWGEFAASVATWFDATWTVIGYGLWAYGSVYPTAPLAFKKA